MVGNSLMLQLPLILHIVEVKSYNSYIKNIA